MAQCIQCLTDVGCSCNLVNGLCSNCRVNNIQENSINRNQSFVPEKIIQSSSNLNALKKQEKLERINKIIREAAEKLDK